MLMWNSLAIIQKIIIIATCIVTLHEWEEQRFPGGFFDVMSRIWQIDLSNIDLHDMYAKPDIYIFAITFLALIFPNTLFLSCAVLLLGVFEGFIHIMGIKLAKLEKPYTPGMITGELYAVFSISCIIFLIESGMTGLMDWILGFIWIFLTFLIMEFFVWRTAGISPKDLSSKARSVIFNKD
jgi:hypothetical protein